MNKLLIHRNGVFVREADLLPVTVIGRHKDNTVQLEDPQISRVHASITLEGGAYLVKDHGSMNGTFLNNRKLDLNERAALADGDLLRLESFELRVTIAATPASAPPASLGPPITADLGTLDAKPEPAQMIAGLVDGTVPLWTKGETRVVVSDIIDETRDVKTLRLVGVDPTLFCFKPGQFIALTVDIDGKPATRSYSISSSPSRPHTLELTIKRTPGGLVSNWVAEHLKLGDELTLKGPGGKFSCFNYPTRKLLCIAAGSGVTPIMSMIRWMVDTSADVDVVFLNSVRSTEDIIFRKELEYISARHQRIRVLFTLTGGWGSTECWTGLCGRVNADLIRLVAPDYMDRHVFMCGPKPFGDAVKEQLLSIDFPAANLHTESFGGGKPGNTRTAPGEPKTVDPTPPPPPPAPAPAPVPVAPPPPLAPVASAAFMVRFGTSGVEVPMDPDPDAFLLDLAENNGIEMDYACRMGACGSCVTRCVSGTVEMGDGCSLDGDQLAAGMILPCIARPTSNVEIEA